MLAKLITYNLLCQHIRLRPTAKRKHNYEVTTTIDNCFLLAITVTVVCVLRQN